MDTKRQLAVPSIQISDASLGYRGHVLLQNLSAELKEGEIITLIGPNGAGKSTILKSVIHQLPLIKGNIAVAGRELFAYADAQLARIMAVLLTDQIKGGYMTVREVISHGRYPFTGRMGMLSPEDERIIEDALGALDLADLGDRLYAELSDGQKQRVLIARAIAQKPSVLVLDEPTSYLDIRYQLLLMDLVRRLAKEEGATVLMSLHEIDLAAKISDRILAVGSDQSLLWLTPEDLCSEKPEEETPAGDLFKPDSGSFDLLTGTTELARPNGQSRAFVLSSGGTGIPVFRKLVREGVPFTAGILYENDLDYRFAVHMAADVISAKPFEKIPDEAVRKAMEAVKNAELVIDAGVPIGEMNRNMQPLIEEIRRRNSSGLNAAVKRDRL